MSGDAGRPFDAPAGDAGAEVDSGSAADGGGGLSWESVETLSDDGAVITERVSYRSGPLRIEGQVCRPSGGERRPVLVFNHGGWMGLFSGLGDGGFCDRTARTFGWAVIESSYRGEDESDGEIEICLGEVDDVLAMMEVGLAQPWADPD